MSSLFPRIVSSFAGSLRRQVWLLAPVAAVLLSWHPGFARGDAEPAPGAKRAAGLKGEAARDEPALIVSDAFVRAHATVFRKKNAEQDFNSILQPIVADLTMLKLCTEPGKVVWNHVQIKATPVRFAAFAFKSPLTEPADLYWIYSSRESGLNWSIMPAEGGMDGFKRYDRVVHPHYVDQKVPVHDYVYCQSLTDGRILPGKVYIVWFAQRESQNERRLAELMEWHKKQGTKLTPEQLKAIAGANEEATARAKDDTPISIAIRLVPTGSVSPASNARGICQRIGPMFAESPGGALLYEGERPVYSVNMTPEGRSLVVLDATPMVQVLDRASKEVVRKFEGDAYYSRGAISPDGKRFVAGAYQLMEVSCWDLGTGEALPPLNITWNGDVQAQLKAIPGGYEESVDVLSFVRGADQILVQIHAAGPRPGFWQHDVVLWDIVGNREVQRLSLGQGTSDGELCDAGKKLLVTRRGEVSRGDQKPVEIAILDWKTGNADASISLGVGTVSGRLHASPDGRLVSACMTRNSRNDFEVYDIAARKRIATVPTSVAGETFIGRGIEFAAWSPDSRWMALAFADATVRLLDVNSSRIRATYLGHIQPIRSLAFTPDGKFVISASDDGTVRQWEVEFTGR